MRGEMKDKPGPVEGRGVLYRWQQGSHDDLSSCGDSQRKQAAVCERWDNLATDS